MHAKAQLGRNYWVSLDERQNKPTPCWLGDILLLAINSHGQRQCWQEQIIIHETLIWCSESQCQLYGSLHPRKMGNSALATTDRVNFIGKCCQAVADTRWSISFFFGRTNNRHYQTPFEVNMNCNTSSNILFGCLGTSVDVVFCLLGFLVVLNCPEITGGGVWEHICPVCLWVMYASQGLYESSLNTVQALHGAAKFNIEILSERKNFNHLTLLQHPKTETSL